MSDELRAATEWYTAGVTHLLGPAAPLTLDAVEESESPWGVEMLLVGRHRARRLLGEPHDDGDDLADELHAEHDRLSADLAARDRAQAWPPPRNGACWCGSARKYKKCCGNPALA